MPVIKIRRGTTTQWTASNRVLQVGELGLDTTLNKLKAGNGTTAWLSLPFLQADVDVTELAQDAVATAFSNGTHSNITVTYDDATNKISLATGPDVITQTGLTNTLTNSTTGYVPLSDVGSADGVASLGPDGKIPDTEIPAGIARDTEIPSNTDSLSEGTTNKYFTDERAQDAIGNSIGTGLSYNDTSGAISVDTSTIATQTYVGTAVSNLINSAPDALNTLNELATALGNDANYATTISTALGNKLNSSTAALTYLSISEPSVDYYISNSGSGGYLVNGVLNGSIHFEKGKKYRIVINASGHPFWIQTVSGGYSSGNVYNTGITNAGTDNGRILVELPQSAPSNLYYACQYHSSMAGSISIGAINPIIAPVASPTFTGTVSGITSAMVGLGNVDNVSTTTIYSNQYILVTETTRTISSTTDKFNVVEFNSSNPITVTIPNDTQDAGWPVGSSVEIRQIGTGQISIAKDAAVTYYAPDSQFKSRVQWSSLFLEKRAANSWLVTGDATA